MRNGYRLEMKPAARQEAVVAGDKYRFTVLTDSLIRLEYQEDGLFVDEPTQTAICRDFPVPDYRVIDRDGSMEIVTEKLHLYYNREAFSKEGLTIHLKEGFHVYGSVWSYGDATQDLKGTARTLDNADGAVELESGLMSRDGFTVLDDSAAALLDAEQWLYPKDRESIDLYFFGYGHDYLRCLRDFYRLSGMPPLLPRFAMGNWWSRFYRYTEESYLALMERFREEKLPFSVAVIDMDWHLTELPPQYGSGWTGYTWDRAFFPEPERFLDALNKLGLRVTLNVHPADGVRAFEEAYPPMAKALGIDWENKDKIPFDAADRSFLEAYFKYLHHPNEERGVDFWWVDWQQGNRVSAKGVDTLWMLNHLHFLDSGRDGRRPLILSRYAGLGSHRYPIGFSGDSYATWESLDFQPYFTVTASNAGYTWWSHDIGGHQGGRRDDELAVRWLQFGVFSPVLRLHSTSNEFFGKEPWNYNAEAEKVMTDFLRLRHKLIPYLYSMNGRTHREGLPLMRPMYYHHDVPEAYEVPNEYYFGTEMIVCPITKPADRDTLLAEFDAWLPNGDWFDFFTGQLYKGGRKIKLYRALDSIPVFVRAGGIIPLAKDYMDAHRRNPAELEVHIYNGADGEFALYEDNCAEEMETEAVVTRFAFTAGKIAELSIETEGNTDGVIPRDRRYDVRIHGIAEPHQIVFAVQDIAFTSAYDSGKKELRICFGGENLSSIRMEFHTPDAAIVGQDKLNSVFRILKRARIEYSTKEEILAIVEAEQEAARLFGKLFEKDLIEPLLGAIIEQIIADI